MKHLLLSGLAAAVMLTCACQGTTRQTTQDDTAAVAGTPVETDTSWPLQGTKWKLKELAGGPATPQTNEKEIFFTLVDTSSQVQGFLGCNGFGGKYLTTANGDLQISDIISTQMACPSLEVENIFKKAMEGTSRYKIEKDVLKLQKGDSVLAVFTAIQP